MDTSASACCAGSPSAQAGVVAEAEEDSSEFPAPLGQAGNRSSADLHQREKEYQWPAVSVARMRAGLRSALKTESSGFKFQNGGRSLRWFREHPIHYSERARLFWQGHVSLFQQSWEVVNLSVSRGFYTWTSLDRVDNAYRQRYSSVHNTASRGEHRSHDTHWHAMLADGNVERAARWALDPQNGALDLIVSSRWGLDRHIFLTLALVGGWTWLLEPWQAVVRSDSGDNTWYAMIACAAVETGLLPLVQEYWPQVRAQDRTRAEMWRAVGLSGSVEVFDWLVQCSFACDVRDLKQPVFLDRLMEAAASKDHVELMEHVLICGPRIQDYFTNRGLLNKAVAGGHLRAVEWLVSRGAQPNEDCIGFAVRYSNYAILRYLREHTGAPMGRISEYVVEALLSQSKPDSLAVLEYLVRHFQYVPTRQNIVSAATTANVRSEVLSFCATHATRQVWDSVRKHLFIRTDLDVQDLLSAAAHGAGRLRL